MSTTFQQSLTTAVEFLKQLGYTYKDGKIYNKKGVLASYPVLDAKTDAIRIFVEKDGEDVAIEAPLEAIVMAWHGKDVREDAYPTNIDGDESNTNIENLTYAEQGEKVQPPHYRPRTKEELQAALFFMGVHPDAPAESVSCARLLSEIATLKKERASIPLGAVPNMYDDFVASRMNKSLNVRNALTNYAMGLSGEAGEVVDLIKKHMFHGHPLDVATLVDELGDVMFYLQALCNVAGVDLVEVLLCNIRKLTTRYPAGFSNEASLTRKDVKEV